MYDADAGKGPYADDIRSNFSGRDVLAVPSYPVAQIIEVSDVFEQNTWDNRVRLAEILESVKGMVGMLNPEDIKWWSDYESQGSDIPVYMARALTLDLNHNGQRCNTDDYICFDRLLTKLISNPSVPLEEYEEEYFTASRTNYSNRRFFTGNEGYMGIVPHYACAGDPLAVLLGSSVPFALRASETNDGRYWNNSFQLLGQAWVEFSVMDGYYVTACMKAGLQADGFFLI